MTEKIKPILVKISKINLKIGDYLIFRFPADKYTYNDVIKTAGEIAQTFPGISAMFFYDDVQVDVVHQDIRRKSEN